MSAPDSVVGEALRWLRFSREDLALASRIMETAPIIPRHAAGLSQQAAEKALKAALVLEQIEFPFIHDLDRLRNLLPDGWGVKDTHDDLVELSEWAGEARYPGARPEPAHGDAAAAVAQARSIYESIAAEFSKRGALAE